jgi:hypothetical protein
VNQQERLVLLVLTFGNVLHNYCRGPTSFECRFLKESEESLVALVKNSFCSNQFLLKSSVSTRMVANPQLPVSTPHVEKLADFLVLPFPIYPLASPGTIHGGLAYIAVLEHDVRRCNGATYDTALGHDCLWSRVGLLVVVGWWLLVGGWWMQIDSSS